MNRKRAIVAIMLLCAVILIADQTTKWWVRQTIPLNTSYMPIEWLDRFVTLTHVENRGVAFGLLQGLGGVSAVIAVGLAVAIGWWVWRYPDLRPFMWIVFGLMLGGALGNLIDRVRQNGVVTDFVDVRWWPVFNVADSCLVVGAVLLAVYTLFFEGRQQRGEAVNAAHDEAGDAA